MFYQPWHTLIDMYLYNYRQCIMSQSSFCGHSVSPASKEQGKDWIGSDKERPRETAECWPDLWKKRNMLCFALAVVTCLGC